jgi:hypothetical protein
MKRPFRQRRIVGASHDVKKDLSKDQLAAIGAVALAYNYAEAQIDQVLGAALDIWARPFLHEVTTRINGVDGKIEIIVKALPLLVTEDTIRADIEDSLGNNAFKRLKQYRDAIIHARVLDRELELGHVIERRARRSEVLLSVTALERLYEHLTALEAELSPVALMINSAHRRSQFAPDDPERERLEANYQESNSLFQSRRTKRRSLPPLPEFPEEPEIRIFRVPLKSDPS